ncbi:Cyst wall protein C [Spironucleus salmonicida]|uniref:Cyst wall protein C n=1 Tax=Spironucleus salmonicida TaxID=348837 RepID=V6LEG6_9EUKA|nr:Cyst wall protein C [Spironucleus salmonicida]|eukprot:EST42091.1 Cyst wall protein C [Spironucleus salmonicida]
MLILSLACFPSPLENLQALYHNSNGSKWSKGHDWRYSNDYCAFQGVKCGLNNEVIELDLSDFGITFLSPELSCFNELKSLYLNNNLISIFPSQICSYAQNLQFLQLSNTNMSRLHDCICDFKFLQFLHIDNNQIQQKLPNCKFEFLNEFIGSCNDFYGPIPQYYKSIKKVFLGCNKEIQECGNMKNVVCGNSDCEGCGLVCPAIWENNVCGRFYLVRE